MRAHCDEQSQSEVEQFLSSPLTLSLSQACSHTLTNAHIPYLAYKPTDTVTITADKREFLRISQAVGMGFLIMGVIGYIVKLSEYHPPLSMHACLSLLASETESRILLLALRMT
jgi:preprotein translocase subunit Sss1